MMRNGKSQYDTLYLLCYGAGAAAYGFGEMAGQDIRLASKFAGVTVVDFDTITSNNLITCPGYAGFEGEWKSSVLPRLWSTWLRRAGVQWQPGPLAGIPSRVQAVDCRSLFPNGQMKRLAEGERQLVLGIVCLDDWEARIHVETYLRVFASECSNGNRDMVLIQISLDRHVAQVRVHGTGYENTCQVCALDTIPEREPCVLFQRAAADDSGSDTERAELVRGNLRAESRAAGNHASDVIASLLDGDFDSWIDTKTQIRIEEAGGTITKTTSRRRKQAGCFGPHSPPDDTFDLSQLLAEVGT